jgi:hypothetical protein
MLSHRRPARGPAWGRNKLVALLAGAAAAVLLIVVGLGLAVYYTVTGSAPHSTTAPPSSRDTGSGTAASSPAASTAGGGDRGRQDALAAAPMTTVDLAASRPGPVSARSPGSITMPKATASGPAGVPTGFPRTREGAMAQLAAIDQTAFQSGSLDGVRAVIASWAAPGGPTPGSWSAVKAMAELLDAAGLSGGGIPQLALVVTPLMGLMKGSVGPDFVIPCVDFEFDATITQTVRVADADCQRMQWTDGRWLIGAGPEPAVPPSVWPDTDTAINVGYQDLRHA